MGYFFFSSLISFNKFDLLIGASHLHVELQETSSPLRQIFYLEYWAIQSDLIRNIKIGILLYVSRLAHQLIHSGGQSLQFGFNLCFAVLADLIYCFLFAHTYDTVP